MPSIDKKYYHNLDLDSNEIKAGRIYNLTTTQRTALTLSTADKGYLVYDTTLLSLFVWDGTAWTSAGGGSQNLQQVTTTGNTTTNNIVLDSTTGEYPYNAIGQNIITDKDISISYSSATYPFNYTSLLGSGYLSMAASNSTVSMSVQTGDGILYMSYSDSLYSERNGSVELGAVDFFGSSYLALTNKLSQAGYLKVTNLTNNNVVLEFPNKTAGSYTIATIADIPQSATLAQTLVAGNVTAGTNIKINDADAIELENTSLLKKGTYDFGANGGISRICGVGYEDMWQSGIRHVFDSNGFIRNSTNCFNIIPDNTFDNTLRFKVGSLWTLDNGNTYECTDATTATAMWTLRNNFVPTLQQVTTTGSTTNNTIIVNDLAGLFTEILPDSIGTQNVNAGTYAYLNSSGFLALNNGIEESKLLNTNVGNQDIWLEFPDETVGSYTIPTNVNGIYADSTGAVTIPVGTGTVTDVSATSPITSSGGTTPIISTSMNTNKLIGRSSASTGVMEEITVGSGLILSGGTLTNNATPTPIGYYGAWQDIITQTAAANNTGYPMLFRTVDVTPNGISIVSNSRITFANTGIYNIQFSSEFQSASSQIETITIWLSKNGTDVPGSAGVLTTAVKKAGSTYTAIAAWNYLLEIVGGDYYELLWSTTNHTDVTMQTYAAGNPPPASASVILSVTQQSGIMAGTGLTAINSLTGAVQTLSTGTTGTDFAIVDSGTDHKFNLPTASATIRGALSSTDWTTFNSKGNGDMLLASIQTNSGVKTFLDTTLLLRNVANTFNGSFVNTNTADRIYTLPDTTTTLAGLAVANTFTEKQTITPPTLTAALATSALNITQTLNTTGAPDIILLDVINTASGSATTLLNLKVGGVSLFRVSKAGEGVMASAKIGTISFVSNNVIAAAAAADLRIVIPTTTKALVVSSDYSSSTGTSAILEVKSTAQGFLPPRMTSAQRLAIASPATGLMVYQTDGTEGLYIKKSGAWALITAI